MVLYQDELMRLEYASAQDILLVEPLTSEGLCFSKVKRIFSSIIACLRERAVKNLLLDFSHAPIVLTTPEYRAAVARLTVGLTATAIDRIARVATNEPARESAAVNIDAAIRQAIGAPIKFRNFPDRAEALRWLME